MRVACLRVADLALVAELRAHPELAGQPLAIAAGAGPRAELVAVSPEAQRVGLRPGTTVVHGRAACADLAVRVASPALERAAREALVDAALSASPRAVPASPGTGAWKSEACVFLDASGVDTLFHSESGFAGALCERARRLGLPAAAAVAGSREVAQLAVRSLGEPGAVRVIPPGAEAAFLAPLPLDLLDPDDRLAQALLRFGVRRLGQLAALPRRALAARLGSEAVRLATLAQGEGSPLALPVPVTTRIEEALDLEHAIDRLEPLGFVLRGVLSRLATRLAVRGLACGDLELCLDLDGGGRDARRVGVAAPTDDARVLLRLVGLALESHPPGAAVEALAVACEGRPVRRDQLDLFRPAGPAPAVLGRTLAELESLCGEGRVGAPAPLDDHRPDAFEVRPFAAGARAPGGVRSPRRHALAVRVLRPPAPAHVQLDAAGRPTRVESAAARGDVVAAAGPWRTSGGWWSRERRFALDHYDVQTEDGNVVRLRHDALARRWSIDAVYD